MIADEDDVLGTLENRNESFRLCRLRRFVNKHLSEAEISDPSIKGSDASCTDDICISEDFLFCLPL